MGLTAALSIGRSALAAGQLGVQVASNNMANAATPGYSRQIGRLVPMRGDRSIPGITIGAGVLMRSVLRQVDEGLESRLRAAISDNSFAQVQSSILAQVEDILGELGESDLSSQLSQFFRAWSERANQSASSASVVQQGSQLAAFIRRLRGDLANQRAQIDAQIAAEIDKANQIIDTIAQLNAQISQAEVGGNVANTLRDQRDQAVRELSELLDITVVSRGQQGVDILAGSTPIILGSQPRNLSLRAEQVGDESRVAIVAGENQARLDVTSGSLASLLQSRDAGVVDIIERLDALTATLIFEVNRLHSTGARAAGLSTSTGTLAFSTAQRSLALNDPSNTPVSGLPFRPVAGGFLVHVRQNATGTTETVRINVDLDGLTSTGTPGTSDDTTAGDIVAQIDAIPGLSATFTPDGRVSVSAAEGFVFSFAEDSSGVLAVLGLNSYFTGTDASDIGVREELTADSSLLSAGRFVNGNFIENATALDVAALQTRGLSSLGGISLMDAWREGVQVLGSRAASARSVAQAASLVSDGLEAQRAAISGVSVDEEALSLMDYQRQYQAGARIISVAQELTQTLMELL
jgi:flagellar hook-associated protein 1 FlgK